jgi:plasmid stabilization system protein ParE
MGRSNRFIVTPRARADLLAIQAYLGPRNPEASERVRHRLFAGIHKVARSPELGHGRPDLTSRPLRFWLVRPYLIVYEPDSRPLRIVRVVHSAQNIVRELGG